MEQTDGHRTKTKPEQERKSATLETASEVSQTDLELINRYTRSPLAADQVYTMKLQLCDNDVDRQFEKFSSGALRQLAALFEGKTVIFDHSWSAKNQTARIYSTTLETVSGKANSDGEPYQRVVAMAYMLRLESTADTISAVDGGIIKEGSVGFRNTKSTCSICGNEYYSGDCPHWRGQKYTENGVEKTCTLILDDVTDAYEFSLVAVPAQREAGITKGMKAGRALSQETKAKMKAARSCRDQAAALEAQARAIEDELVGEWPEDDPPDEEDPEDTDEAKALKAQINMIIGG